MKRGRINLGGRLDLRGMGCLTKNSAPSWSFSRNPRSPFQKPHLDEPEDQRSRARTSPRLRGTPALRPPRMSSSKETSTCATSLPPPSLITPASALTEGASAPKRSGSCSSTATILPAGRGCVRRTLRLDRVSEACADGVPIAAAETALRIEAVVGPNEEIVTCWRRAPRSLARERRSRTRHRGRRA